MRLVHDSGGDAASAVLATDIDWAESVWTKGRGLMFRRSIPDDYALVFEFDAVTTRGIHMLFVPFPIDVVWTVDEVVERVATLRPWIGIARGRADRIVELPAGTAAAVEPGDRLVIDSESAD